MANVAICLFSRCCHNVVRRKRYVMFLPHFHLFCELPLNRCISQGIYLFYIIKKQEKCLWLSLVWAVWVWSLAGNIVLCSWARHITLTVPLSTQVNKWVPANLTLEVTLRWTSIPYRGEILLVASCYGTWDKPWPDGILVSNPDLTTIL